MRSRRDERTDRMLASAGLAAALLCGDPGIARAEDEPSAPDAATGEQRADATTPRPTEPSEANRAAPAARAERSTKPFVPTDRIDAESVVPFPADI